MLVDNLEHIEIARDNLGANAGGLCFARKSADDIVSFVIVEFVKRNMKSLEQLHEVWNLRVEIWRSWFAVSFVIWIDFATTTNVSLRLIPSYSNVFRLQFFDNFDEHCRKAKDATSWRAVWE